MGWLLLFLGAVYAFARRNQTTAPAGQLPAAEETRRDGPYAIYLWREGGRWRWRAELEDPVILPDGVASVPETLADEQLYATVEDALVAAWRRLVLVDYGPDIVVPAAIERVGLRLNANGTITITNQATYVNHASPIISQATQTGDDGAGIVLAVLIDIFGWNWNPLRVRIAGGSLQQAAARVDAVQPPNPPAVARAIVGV